LLLHLRKRNGYGNDCQNHNEQAHDFSQHFSLLGWAASGRRVSSKQRSSSLKIAKGTKVYGARRSVLN
jgi:hypothetical protein